MINNFIARLDELVRILCRGEAVNVNDKRSKDHVLELGKNYFREIRPQVAAILGEIKEIQLADRLCQSLIELAQGNNARKTYIKTAKNLRSAQVPLNMMMLRASGSSSSTEPQHSYSEEEELAIKTLNSLVPSAAASYRQALHDLRDGNRHSYRGTAAELREALRETVDHLAPDDAVTKSPGFKLEKDIPKPTMKQKIKYLLSERDRNKAQLETSIDSVKVLEELMAGLARSVYNEASMVTHGEKTLKDAKRLKRYIDLVLSDVLELI